MNVNYFFGNCFLTGTLTGTGTVFFYGNVNSVVVDVDVVVIVIVDYINFYFLLRILDLLVAFGHL